MQTVEGNIRGVLFIESFEFVRRKRGLAGVRTLHSKIHGGFGYVMRDFGFEYTPLKFYPSIELRKLTKEASRLLGVDEHEFCVQVGERAYNKLKVLLPGLLKVDDEKSAILKLNTILNEFFKATEPLVTVKDRGREWAVMFSPVVDCGIVDGILRGVSSAVNNGINIRQTMHASKGDPLCEFVVSLK